jgi:HCOMODA/2-hydroxy-3-carboxy-muconic semialdehyde decarboxylase
MASVIGAEVPKWDSQAEFGDTNMLIDDLDKGRSLARALGQWTCVVLRGHGSACAAASLAAVCFISVYMSENAKVVLETLRHGNPVYLSPGEVAMTAKMLLGEMPMARAWDYYKARAGFQAL